MMVPCKFQTDSTGANVLVYSEDRETVHAVSGNSEFVALISAAVGLEGPMQKRYAMAEQNEQGQIVVGERLPELDW